MTFPAGKIAIVGNGGCEIGKNRGAEIDAHDFIFRFHNYKLHGFESDYGSRTTHWVTSFWYNVPPHNPDDYAGWFCPLPLLAPEWIHRYHVEKYKAGHDLPTAYRCKDFCEFMPLEIFEKLLSINFHPSTGISLIYWMFLTRGLAHVDLYGFSFFDQSEPMHYWEQAINGHHNGAGEKNLLEIMLK